jgi:hypothetical protein
VPQETPAGWYPAPHANDEPRYWDGHRWLDGAPAVDETTAMPVTTPSAHQAPPFGSSGSPRGPQPRSLAIAAVALGGAAFLTGLVPVLGLLLAIAAVVLGILALVRSQPKKLAVPGLALGSIALLTGIIATAAGLTGSGTEATTASAPEPAAATSQASAPAEEADEAPAPVASDVSEPEVAEAAEPEPAPSEVPAEIGTVQNPMPQPYVAEGLFGGEKYSLMARIVDANANALVAQWNMFNSEAPAGYKYVVVELAMTGIDTDGVEPSLASYDLSLATPEGNRYDSEYIIFGDGMPSMTDGPTLYPGSAFTGYTAYIVPEAAQSFMLHDNGEYIAF